jgi:hypothetical protein
VRALRCPDRDHLRLPRADRRGGAAGVGRAVNRAVVGCLVAIFLVNLLFTQWFLALFPETGVFR